MAPVVKNYSGNANSNTNYDFTPPPGKVWKVIDLYPLSSGRFVVGGISFYAYLTSSSPVVGVDDYPTLDSAWTVRFTSSSTFTYTLTVEEYDTSDIPIATITANLGPQSSFSIRPPAGKVWVIKSLIRTTSTALYFRLTNGANESNNLALNSVNGSASELHLTLPVVNAMYLIGKNISSSSTHLGAVQYLELDESDLQVMYGWHDGLASSEFITVRPPVGEVWRICAGVFDRRRYQPSGALIDAGSGGTVTIPVSNAQYVEFEEYLSYGGSLLVAWIGFKYP